MNAIPPPLNMPIHQILNYTARLDFNNPGHAFAVSNQVYNIPTLGWLSIRAARTHSHLGSKAGSSLWASKPRYNIVKCRERYWQATDPRGKLTSITLAGNKKSSTAVGRGSNQPHGRVNKSPRVRGKLS